MLMASPIYTIILGVVEGITEFLPVSSTGHLIVLTYLLQFRETGGTFGIGIQWVLSWQCCGFTVFYSPPLLPRARF
jgi:undecaprenyl-diphosphatase